MEPLDEQFAQLWPPATWRDVTVVVAVSGGADSVALLRLLATAAVGGRGRLVVSHFHHGRRGAAADADAAFVRSLATQLDLACELGRAAADTPPRSGQGLESNLRRQRYAFLRTVADRRGARYVATGHTADDQAETILHHVLRGTALTGLAGIPRLRRLSRLTTLVRPLRDVRRADLRVYLAALGQPFREDASNTDRRHTRNRIRQDLLPLLQREFNPAVVAALTRLGRVAEEAQLALEPLVEQLFQQAVRRQGPHLVHVDCRPLANAGDYLLQEMFVRLWRRADWPRQPMGRAEWQTLARSVRHPSADHPVRMLPGHIRLERTGDTLRIERRAPPAD